MRCLATVLAIGVAGAAACSVVNAPDDAVQPGTSDGGQTTGGGGGGGGDGGLGGDGGQGGIPAPQCGNGVVEGDEACDDGAATADCDDDCTAVECGDGVINGAAAEQCDDGGTALGDACDDQCQISAFAIDDTTEATGFMTLFTRPGVALTQVSDEDHFIAAWTRVESGAASVVATVFTATGEAVDPAQKSVSTTFGSAAPTIASNAQGLAVVTWVDLNSEIVRYRVLEAGGVPASGGEKFIPNAKIEVGFPVMAAGFGGEFCMAWQQEDATADYLAVKCLASDGSDNSVAMQNIGASVSPGGSSILGMQSITAVQNGFVLGYFVDAAPQVYTGHKIDVTGVAQGAAAPLSQMAGISHAAGGVGNAQSDAFFATFVVDDTFGEADSVPRPLVRPFTNLDTPLEGETLITAEHVEQINAVVIPHDSGRFLVAWVENINDDCTIKARAFTADRIPRGPAFTVAPEQTDVCSYFPTGAANSAGDVMIAYVRRGDAATTITVQGVIHPRVLAE